MILKTKSMPDWLSKFADALGAKNKPEKKDVIAYDQAEKLGFFKNATLLGHNMFQVSASDHSGFFDAGSVWYMEEGEGGEKFLMKQTDEAGNIIRRMGKLQKRAQKAVENYRTKDIVASLNHIHANIDNYDPYKIKDEINQIEDSILVDDPTLSKEGSISIISKINSIRALADSSIENLVQEYDKENEIPAEPQMTLFDEENRLANLQEKRISELKETQASLEQMIENTNSAVLKDQYKSALTEVKRELTAALKTDDDEPIDASAVIGRDATALLLLKEEEGEEGKPGEEKEAVIEKEAQTAVPASPAAPSGSGADQGMKITEELFESPTEAESRLKQHKTTQPGDTAEYEIKQDSEGGTGKFKIFKKAFVFKMTAGRIHDGKLVRIFNERTALTVNTNVIKCITPNCQYNDSENGICTKRMISVADGLCDDRVDVSGEKKAGLLTLSDRQVNSEMEKEIPSEPIEDITPPAGDQGEQDVAKDDDDKLAPDASEDQDKKVADFKSKVWEQAGKEAIDENLDFERAEDSFYAKMIQGLEEGLSSGEITETVYNSLVDELEQLKDEDTLREYLENELLYETTQKDVGKEDEKDEEEEAPAEPPPLENLEQELGAGGEEGAPAGEEVLPPA